MAKAALKDIAIRTRVRTFDIATAQKYLRGVSSLASEGAQSSEPRVILTALEILRRSPVTIDRLFQKAA